MNLKTPGHEFVGDDVDAPRVILDGAAIHGLLLHLAFKVQDRAMGAPTSPHQDHQRSAYQPRDSLPCARQFKPHNWPCLLPSGVHVAWI